MSNMKNQSAILVTGAGSGIGRAIAQVLAQKNPESSIILTGRKLNALQETLNTLPKTQNHQALSLDVTQLSSIRELKADLLKQNITLKALVLNAGIGGENHYGEHDRWAEILATNLTGPYQLTQELLPLIQSDAHTFKNIVFVSSILARLGVPGYSAYCASKAAVLGLMRSMAAEYASQKILVNAICPGWVDTEMSTQGLQQMASGMKKTFDQVKTEQMAMVPLQKMSAPTEIAELINFLVSGVQTSFTGQTLDMNNGALMP